ncbi:TIGR02281 family clan AA aspartic protease [Candidatus Bandiella euplotis]|uniref:Aspartic protease n=1 Tax=Candidatus Bandiella euplotis TaxID=1664265 RepID=A0ABZ0UJM8_9RICK|nr:TIGR02281 family clan AA aspartic protease [Candidatus Bandiella woodruffii]WPX96308.1 Putative aspartic protease [Candidatus Bandiella woodruffii]
MKNKFFFIALITAVLVYLLKERVGHISLDNDRLLNVVYAVIIISTIGMNIISSRIPLGQVLSYAAVWTLIIGTLLTGYTYKADLQNVFNKVYANLIPGTVIQGESEDGNGKVVMLVANQSAHFFANAQVNGVDISFLIDTGATDVALTRNDAKKLGINLESLSYTKKVLTANGTTWSAPIKLDSIQVGDITVNDVSASVSIDEGLDVSLLGMSFLNKLDSYQVHDDTLSFFQK